MKKTGWTILLATALSYIPVAGAQEQASEEPFKTTDWRKDFSIAIGTKLWFNEWTTWDVLPIDVNFNGVIDEFDRFEVTSNEADGYEFTPIPALSVKYHEFFVSASYFVDTTYRFPAFDFREFDRREWDVTTGYYLFPPYLALTIGFKEIQRTIRGLEFKVDGPVVGFTGAVPIKWGFSLYNSFAYGFMQTESDFFGPFGDDDRDTEYWLIEGGIAYTHNLQNLPVNLLLSSATFYAGYRHQQVETDVSDDPNANDALDITRGMVIGLNLSF